MECWNCPQNSTTPSLHLAIAPPQLWRATLRHGRNARGAARTHLPGGCACSSLNSSFHSWKSITVTHNFFNNTNFNQHMAGVLRKLPVLVQEIALAPQWRKELDISWQAGDFSDPR